MRLLLLEDDILLGEGLRDCLDGEVPVVDWCRALAMGLLGHGWLRTRLRQERQPLQREVLDATTPLGLGLLLADRVARAHGGALSLPDVEHGFAARLTLGAACLCPADTASPAVPQPEPPPA